MILQYSDMCRRMLLEWCGGWDCWRLYLVGKLAGVILVIYRGMILVWIGDIWVSYWSNSGSYAIWMKFISSVVVTDR